MRASLYDFTKPNYLPKAPSNTITLDVRALTDGFGADTNIHFVTDAVGHRPGLCLQHSLPEVIRLLASSASLEGDFVPCPVIDLGVWPPSAQDLKRDE